MLAFWWAIAFALVVVRAHDPRLDGVQALVKRRVPSHADSFSFQLVNGTEESFVLRDSKGKGGIDVQCTTVSACSRGLYT